MSTKVINLLPRDQQRELGLRSWYRALKRFYVLAITTFAIVVLLFAGTWWYLRLAEQNLAHEAENLRAKSTTQETTDLKKRIKTINNQIEDYNTLTAALPRWSVLLRQFATLVPQGAQVQSFGVDSTKRQVIISGFASTREASIQLHDNIARDEAHFSNIDYPLENISKPTNVGFKYSFVVKPEVLVSKAP